MIRSYSESEVISLELTLLTEGESFLVERHKLLVMEEWMWLVVALFCAQQGLLFSVPSLCFTCLCRYNNQLISMGYTGNR